MNTQIDPRQVHDLLFGDRRQMPYSFLDLNTEIHEGVPVEAVSRLAKLVAPTKPEWIEELVASRSTLKRHRRATKVLGPLHSERLGHLAEVWLTALDVYKDAETARMFLQRPHQLLHGRAPLEVAVESSYGARTVQQILGRLKHGAAA